MPGVQVENGKVFLQRTEPERRRLVHALNRIEGQVRGVRAMIEADRYCGDELQQIKAAISGLSRVARLLTEQHVNAATTALLDGAGRDVVDADLSRILKTILAI